MAFARRVGRTLVSAVILAQSALAATACAQARVTRVLVLYQQQAETQPMLEFSQALRSTLRGELASTVEFYQEALDLDRFTGREDSSPLTRYFEDKYRGFSIDVVVPVGDRALKFAVDHLGGALPGVPIVFALCAAPRVDFSALRANITGRLAPASRFAPTLAMAHRLQPDADRLVVIGGAGPGDSASVAAVLAALPPVDERLPVTMLAGLPLDTLLRKLRQIPRRSIVIFANYRLDGRGQAFEPLDIVGSLAHAAAAPMYTQLRSYIGEGLVGGSVMRFDDEGVRTARLIARVLGRRPEASMPPVEPIANSFVADWRQLRRWGLSEKLLPPGTDVEFRDPTIWQRYRTLVLLALAVIGAEMFLIGQLLLERSRRIRAQRVLEEQQRRAEETRRQVAHMGRVALVGELAATLSHELRQPLAAIRANAEAGVLLAGTTSADSSEVREIFRSIVDEDVRAVEVIETARKLLRKDKPSVTTVDLNQICRDSVRLLQHDAAVRKTRVDLSLAESVPMVIGDPVQLQQVVLNLLLNGLDAALLSSTDRRVTVCTENCGSDVDLLVHDTGPGIPPTVRPHLFESFFSTKSGGLGLGLVIVRSIVERHRGRVSAEQHALGGTVFRVRLPGVRAAGSPSDGRRESLVPPRAAAGERGGVPLHVDGAGRGSSVGRGGKPDVERGADQVVVGRPDLATVRGDDLPANREAHAQSVRLRRDEGLEDAFGRQ